MVKTRAMRFSIPLVLDVLNVVLLKIHYEKLSSTIQDASLSLQLAVHKYNESVLELLACDYAVEPEPFVKLKAPSYCEHFVSAKGNRSPNFTDVHVGGEEDGFTQRLDVLGMCYQLF